MHTLAGVAVALLHLALLRLAVLRLTVLGLAVLRLPVLGLAVLRLPVLRLPVLGLAVLLWLAGVLLLAGLLAAAGGAGLGAAVHLAVLGGLTELTLVRRWALLRAALIRPRAPVPVALLRRLLWVVVPTGWKAHRQSIT
nr:hypothetical protein [Kribbella antiqua]